MKRLVAALGVAIVLAGFVWWAYSLVGGGRGAPAFRGPSVVVPRNVRIRVEVLNASDVRGLARRATLYLRASGFDVVRFAGDDTRRDSTLIIDRTSHPEWAALASRALGGAKVESRPDSSRFVDLTILLGGTWRAPAQPLDP